MTVRKNFERVADGFVQAYEYFDRPGVGFLDLLTDKGYLAEDNQVSQGEKLIRGVFGSLASGVETLARTVERMDRDQFGFFDFLAIKGHLPQTAGAGTVVPFRVANDNLVPTTGGDRKAA